MIHSTPIILLAGRAGSGKDTVGAFLAQTYNGVCIGQADPMKKFCMDVFGFSEEALWGPSELREKPVSFDKMAQSECSSNFGQLFRNFIIEVVPQGLDDGAVAVLSDWMDNIELTLRERGAITPRTTLQTLGTEWGRSVALDMWNQYTIKAAKALLAGGYSYSRNGGLVAAPGNVVDYVIVTDGRFQNEILNVRYLGGVSVRIDRTVAAAGPAGANGHSSEMELGRIPRHFFSRVLDNNATKESLFASVRRLMQEAYGDLGG